jgi:penicillin amidase
MAKVVVTALSRTRLPRSDGVLRAQGLQRPVEVYRDRWGVPHIYADSEHDLYFAQGFVHAQDRLWQMDLNRRLVAGRLAEVLGSQALPVDRWVRTLSMRRIAELEASAMAPALEAVLEAYAAGVNACISKGRLPIEFTLLRYSPEPWTPADTLAWGKMMSWNLSVNWEMELLRQRLIERVGPEVAAELEPDFAGRRPTIIPPGWPFAEPAGDGALGRAEAARPFTGPSALDGVGSNSWVIGAARSGTGAPLLANDMHLGLELPAVWYENHLVTGDLSLSGITFAGVPGIVTGHNGHVAWGFTNGFADVQDLYVEHLRRTEDGRVEVEFAGAWEEAQVIREMIRVKGADPVTEEVIVTRHGPIINGLAGDFAGEAPLALRWTSLEPDVLMAALYRMNRATDCATFRDALHEWTAPIQNVVYADTQGAIAYSLPGKIPVRARGDGRVPVPGWTGEYEWQGYIPFDELPHMLNPARSYIVTANNRIVDDVYPHFIGYDYCVGDRAQRIVELIEARDRVDMAYVAQMHSDLLSPHARTMARLLGSAHLEDGDLAPVVALMRDWDGTLGADSAAAAVYEAFVREIIRLLLEPKLGDLAIRMAGKGPTPGLSGGSMAGERSWEWIEAILEMPESVWYDLGHGETREACVGEALRRTVAALREALGSDMAGWSWGRLHTLTLRHVLGGLSPLDDVLNRGPVPLGGDQNTVWATGSSRYNVQGQRITGPVYRMIIDLGDVRNSRSVLLPGQSGRPGSPHYDDQMGDWLEGAYHPMLFAREDVEAGAQHRLQLTPG